MDQAAGPAATAHVHHITDGSLRDRGPKNHCQTASSSQNRQLSHSGRIQPTIWKLPLPLPPNHSHVKLTRSPKWKHRLILIFFCFLLQCFLSLSPVDASQRLSPSVNSHWPFGRPPQHRGASGTSKVLLRVTSGKTAASTHSGQN